MVTVVRDISPGDDGRGRGVQLQHGEAHGLDNQLLEEDPTFAKQILWRCGCPLPKRYVAGRTGGGEDNRAHDVRAGERICLCGTGAGVCVAGDIRGFGRSRMRALLSTDPWFIDSVLCLERWIGASTKHTALVHEHHKKYSHTNKSTITFGRDCM